MVTPSQAQNRFEFSKSPDDLAMMPHDKSLPQLPLTWDRFYGFKMFAEKIGVFLKKNTITLVFEKNTFFWPKTKIFAQTGDLRLIFGKNLVFAFERSQFFAQKVSKSQNNF
jgi:hypothetical protein